VSTNSECLFFQWAPEQWYYLLEDTHAPQNAWDWREHAQAYGPFESREVADRHLRDNHSNPGGCSIDDQPDMEDDMLIAKVGEARLPRPGRMVLAWVDG